jgi:hypothetical protein
LFQLVTNFSRRIQQNDLTDSDQSKLKTLIGLATVSEQIRAAKVALSYIFIGLTTTAILACLSPTASTGEEASFSLACSSQLTHMSSRFDKH